MSPKSYAQAKAEVAVTQQFLENFSGDQVRGEDEGGGGGRGGVGRRRRLGVEWGGEEEEEVGGGEASEDGTVGYQ